MTAEWNTALWDTDVWPALSHADLCQQKPLSAHGVPAGLGDWRFSVEVLLPADASALWGVGLWGTAEWNTYAWHDVTDYVRGLEWKRGADEVYGRPRVGEAVITFESPSGLLDPWSQPAGLGDFASFFGPGTVIRAGLASYTDTRAGGWLPQFTMVVDSWVPGYVDGNKADTYVTVTAVETLRDLAGIDDNALASVVGGGETATARIERLLDASDWRYGLIVEARHLIDFPGSYTLNSTDLSLNRVAECYLTADSVDAVFRTHRTGAAFLTNVEYQTDPIDTHQIPLGAFSKSNATQAWIGFDWQDGSATGHGGVPFRFMEYIPDSFRSGNDDANITNDARFARVGGTQQTFEQTASIERYGRRTLVRNDLLCVNDAVCQLIAQYVTIRRALNTLRVDALKCMVTDYTDPDRGLTLAAADVGDYSVVYPPDGDTGTRPRVLGFVRSVTHRVTPRHNERVTWEATFAFDTRTVQNLNGAQLPSTPA